MDTDHILFHLCSSVFICGFNPMMESDKTMFEIYREEGYNRRFKVIYYTELNDHNREFEINRALAGEHYFDGFIKNFKKEEAKERIQGIIQRLNDGELVKPDEIRSILVPYTPQSHAA